MSTVPSSDNLNCLFYILDNIEWARYHSISYTFVAMERGLGRADLVLAIEDCANSRMDKLLQVSCSGNREIKPAHRYRQGLDDVHNARQLSIISFLNLIPDPNPVPNSKPSITLEHRH
jgi:hypothetical protein